MVHCCIPLTGPSKNPLLSLFYISKPPSCLWNFHSTFYSDATITLTSRNWSFKNTHKIYRHPSKRHHTVQVIFFLPHFDRRIREDKVTNDLYSSFSLEVLMLAKLMRFNQAKQFSFNMPNLPYLIHTFHPCNI